MNNLDKKYVFSGIDQQIDDTLMDKNKSADLANSRILPKYSILSKRKGARKYNSQVIWGGKYLRGLFEYFSGTTRRIMTLAGTDLFYDNNDGVFAKAGLSLVDGSNSLLAGVSYKGFAYLANNYNNLITYNGSVFGFGGVAVPAIGSAAAAEGIIGLIPVGTYGYKFTYVYDSYQESDASTAISETTTGIFVEDLCDSIGNWVDGGDDVTLTVDNTDGYINTGCLKNVIIAAPAGNTIIMQKTTTDIANWSQSTSIKFWVKTTIALTGDNRPRLHIRNSANELVQYTLFEVAATDTWTEVTIPLVSPSATVKYLIFNVGLNGMAGIAGKTIKFDQISLINPTTHINLSAIPVSANPRVTARKIYRTINGGSVFYFLTEIANNTAATYEDHTIDADLGAGNPPLNGSIAPSYIKDLVLLQDRLFAISTLAGATSTILCSSSGDPDIFPAAFDADNSKVGGPWIVAEDDGDELVRIFGMEDWLYCFKKNNIYKMYIKGNPLMNWETRTLHNIGCTSYFGIVKGENDFYFYHSSGIYHMIDYNIEKISEPIRDFIKNIATSMTTNTAMCLDRTRKKLLFAFCDPYISPTTINNSMAVYDLVTKEWESIDTNIYIKSFLEKDDGTILYGDYTDGFVKKLNRYEDDQNQEKIIANIDNEVTWTGGADDTTNYKDGLKGLAITATAGATATGVTVFTIAISLATWNNGDISNAEDFIDFWLYHTTRDNVASIKLEIDVNDGAYTDEYHYTVAVADLTAGNDAWTKIHIKKSAFTRIGSTSGKDWSSVKGIKFTVTASVAGTAVVTVDDLRMVADRRKVIATHYKTKAISPISSEIDHHFVDLYLECRKFVDSDLKVKYDVEHGKKVKELTLWNGKNFYLGITDNTNTRIMFRRKNDLVNVQAFASGGGAYTSICADDDFYYAAANGISNLAIMNKTDAHNPDTIFADNFNGSDINADLWTHIEYDGTTYVVDSGKLTVQNGSSLILTSLHSFNDLRGVFEYKFNIDSAALRQIPHINPMYWISSDSSGPGSLNGFFVIIAIDVATQPADPQICLKLDDGSNNRYYLAWTGLTMVAGVEYIVKIEYDASNADYTNFKCYINGILYINYNLPVGSLTAAYKSSFPYEEQTGIVYTNMMYRGVGENSTHKVIQFIIPTYSSGTAAIVAIDYFWGDYAEEDLPIDPEDPNDPPLVAIEGICVDETYLYVTDFDTNRVNIYTKVSPIGYYDTFGSIGDGDNEFSGPCGICCDDLYLYIVDMNNNRVKKHLKTSPYTLIAAYGRTGSGQSRSYGIGNYELKSPFGICVDHTHLWITDGGNYRIMKIRKDLADDCFVAKIGSYGVTGNNKFNLPRGIAVDDIYIYVVDGGNNKVQKREKELLVFIEEYGSSGSGNDQLDNPYDVAINDLDYIVPDRIHTKINIERVGKCISFDFRQKEVGQNMEIMAMDLSYKSMTLKGK